MAAVSAWLFACNSISGLGDLEFSGTTPGVETVADAGGDPSTEIPFPETPPDSSTPSDSGTPANDAAFDDDAGESPIDGGDVDGGQEPPRKYVFVTSTASGPAGFKGLAGADEKCGVLATAAGRTGSWKAWISDDKNAAIDRVLGDGPWYTFDDQVAVASRSELEGTTGITKAIDVDETGQTGVSALVWTGKTGNKGTNSCNDWTTSYTWCIGFCGTGVAGHSDKKTNAWTSDQTVACTPAGRLYCFQQ